MPDANLRVLVLGGYGFIGAAAARALADAGAEVCIAGRDAAAAVRVMPGWTFQNLDLLHMQSPESWKKILQSRTLVVNCAGALQDRAPGGLEQIHHRAIAALAQACAASGTGLVQISAAGADPAASTAFLRSKAAGDAAVRAAGGRHWILRPGLVIGREAFGGTLLLRMLAAVPLVQPMALGGAQVQCAGLEDVARAVVLAASGDLPPGTYDLVEETPQDLSSVVRRTRHWRGFAPARLTLPVPFWALRAAAWAADALGRLGWRPPLRSIALKVLEAGVTGDPAAFAAAAGPLPPLDQVLARLPSGRAARLEARMALLMPLCVAGLCLFWLASGLIGLWQLREAASVLTGIGWGAGPALASVIFWALADIALGAGILWRPWAARACLAMATVTAVYLLAATWLTPGLWADPLGPLVKVGPALLLALVSHQLLQER